MGDYPSINQEGEEDYKPPPGPPPSQKTAYVSEVARSLRPQGWSILNLGPHPHFTYGYDRTYEIYSSVWPALERLFEASKPFFALPSVEKDKYVTGGVDGSEEGYSCIEGEKEFITLRRDGDKYCPDVLKDPVRKAWSAVFCVLMEGLRGVEVELGLPATSLTRFAQPCMQIDERAKATMIRLFRYENDEAKVVAEPHMDLGLLSLVVGDTPGLEVLDHNLVDENGQSGCWHPIEQNFERGMATLMSGRQLQYLTHERYTPGGHRVMSYGKDTPLIPANLDELYPSRSRRLLNKLSISKPKLPIKEKYRYSIVFVLRAHEAVPVDYALLETPELKFKEEDKEARTAGQLFKRIKKAHYNVNIGHSYREEQKRKLMEDHDAQILNQEEGTTATG